MNESHHSAKVTIADVQRQIDLETQRLASDTQAKRDETRRQIEEANRKLQEAKDALPDIINQLRSLNERTQALQNEGAAKERELAAARDKVIHDNRMIRQAIDQDKDKYVAYGRNMVQLLERIKRERWHGEMPLGPLGVHVKCREPEKWGDLLRKQLSSVLTAFSVTDARDSPVLKNMLKASGK